MNKILILLFLSISVWANIGNIMAINGKASVIRSNESLKAISGMKLIKGDEIQTQAKSRVQVMLNDDTTITIGPNSTFGFEDFILDGKRSKVKLRSKRGFFRAVTGKIGKFAPERFRLKTASASIGIRGTDFSGDIGVGREIIKCYSGIIFVEYEGVTKDVVSGMMIELSPDKVEIKYIEETTKGKEDSQSTSSEDVVKDELEVVDVSNEYIADITIDPVVIEPFDMIPNAQDREVLY